MQRNIIIKNGHVVDPANRVNQRQDIYISRGRIVNAGAFAQPDLVLDASDAYVFPGLIDYHAHVFPNSTEIGIDPDSSLLCQGVTTVVDAGSAGVSNIRSFIHDVIERSQLHIESYINLCPSGLPTMKFHEDFDPKHWEAEKLRQLLAEYPDKLLGLKIRISKPIMGSLPASVFSEAKALAVRLHTRLCVHVTDPYIPMEQIATILGPGDILAHCFQGTGATIIGSDGKVLPEIREAQKRGVIMDAANGGNHWCYSVAEAALKQGFFPDLISTDLTCKTLFKDPVWGLPYLMSKYLSLGLSIEEIVSRCTIAPARLLHSQEQLGTLSIGAPADVAIFKLTGHRLMMSDTAGERRCVEKLFVPQLTLRRGELVYRSLLFS